LSNNDIDISVMVSGELQQDENHEESDMSKNK